MDNMPEGVLANLPPGLLDHVTNHGSTYWALYQRFLEFRTIFYQNVLNPFMSLISPLASRMTSNPDLTTIVLLLIILVLSLKMLDMLVRTVMWWIRLVTRLIFWTAVLGTGYWLWQRGFDGAVKDFEAWRHIWAQNYEYYQRQELNARNANGAGLRGTQGAWWPRR